jgi:peptidoglycan/xylan/chitin deacetylase (PgdA/CDA1 family)
MFTVDVESDWGIGQTRGIVEVLPRLVEVLRAAGCGATFFVVADLGDRVRAVLPPDAGFEVGSHGLTHATLRGLAPAQVDREIGESRRRLEAAGYSVHGFRAPFLAAPRDLPRQLAAAGYSYDASRGSVLPSLRNGLGAGRSLAAGHRIIRLPAAVLRDGLSPFSMTWLRLYHPLGVRLVGRRSRMFYCHLHEFLDSGSGWHNLPALLRRLHGRNSGVVAWQILDELLGRFGSRFVSCASYLQWEGHDPARA